MLRRSAPVGFRASPVLLAWTAEEGEPGAPDTVFKNVKPNPLLRLWRQIRQRAWVFWTIDEEFHATTSEVYMHQTRMEQVISAPSSSHGSVPGSYSDPLLYNTKSTSPFRWHSNGNNFDVAGHWYMEADELFRIKDWKPRDPEDPYEMFPHPPNMNLGFEETVDEHGNRHFKYKYKYEVFNPHGDVYPAYPFNHHYGGHIDNRDRVEPYGFKQGELLRCTDEEEEVLRRILEEEDREWSMVKQTELVQEPWSYPGKIRPRDHHGSLERAKARWREDVKAGRPTEPYKNPDYDLVQAGEFVEPRDGDRAEWRDMWQSNRKGKPQDFQSTGNDGYTLDDLENKPPKYPTKPTEGTVMPTADKPAVPE
jgi:hypothetical protein